MKANLKPLLGTASTLVTLFVIGVIGELIMFQHAKKTDMNVALAKLDTVSKASAGGVNLAMATALRGAVSCVSV